MNNIDRAQSPWGEKKTPEEGPGGQMARKCKGTCNFTRPEITLET